MRRRDAGGAHERLRRSECARREAAPSRMRGRDVPVARRSGSRRARAGSRRPAQSASSRSAAGRCRGIPPRAGRPAALPSRKPARSADARSCRSSRSRSFAVVRGPICRSLASRVSSASSSPGPTSMIGAISGCQRLWPVCGSSRRRLARLMATVFMSPAYPRRSTGYPQEIRDGARTLNSTSAGRIIYFLFIYYNMYIYILYILFIFFKYIIISIYYFYIIYCYYIYFIFY